jgi:hypothetical protein
MIPMKKKKNYKAFHQSFFITITLSTTEHNIEPMEHFVYTAMTRHSDPDLVSDASTFKSLFQDHHLLSKALSAKRTNNDNGSNVALAAVLDAVTRSGF